MTRRRYRSARPRSLSRRLLASAFVLACLLASAFSPAPAQTDDIIPPVDDVLPDLREPLGKWEETDPPEYDSGYVVHQLLPSGKVFRYSRNDPAEPAGSTTPRARPEIFDPKGDDGRGKWVARSLPDMATGSEGGQRQVAQIKSAVLLTGSGDQCGESCGKLLIHFRHCYPSDGTVWQLYDPESDFARPSAEAWQDAAASSPAVKRSASASIVLSKNCEPYCGHALVIGEGQDCGVTGQDSKQAELYDPKRMEWITSGQTVNEYVNWAPLTTSLNDGRVLAVGCVDGSAASEVFLASAPASSQWQETQDPPVHCISDPGEGGGPSAIVFGDGRVLATGYDGDNTQVSHTQLFDPQIEDDNDPQTKAWSDAPEACCGKTALLPGDRALVVRPRSSAVIWNPRQPDTSLPAGAPVAIHTPQAAILLSGTGCGKHCGKVLVTGTKEGGALAAELYTPAPDLTSLGPAAGPVTGGTRVEINGYSFIGGDSRISVDFGGVPGKDVDVLSDTKLQVTAPEGAAPGPVQVRVTTDAGKTPQSELSRFTYLPAITALTPSRGPMKGGDEVRVTGKGLDRTESVRFGTAPAKSFRVVSDTEVRAINPSHSKAEPVPLSLSARGLSSVPATTGANMFTYLADSPLTTIDTEPDETVREVIGPTASGGGVSQAPVSPVVPGQGPASGSSFTPGPGTPSLPAPPPSGPLAAPVTTTAPQAGIPALLGNPPPVQPAAVLSQPSIPPLTPGLATAPEEAPRPGVRYALVGLGGAGPAMYFGAALFVFGLSISAGIACGRTSRRPSHVPGLQRAL